MRHDVEYFFRDPEGKKSVALVTLEGTSSVIVGLAFSDQYEVVSGSGVFVVADYPEAQEGISRVPLQEGDTFEVVRHRFYRLEGDLVMLRTGANFREEFAVADPPEGML